MSETQEINLKSCTMCGSTTNSFQPNRKKCTKCRSKMSYEKRKPYFKAYYENNKDMLLSQAHTNYLKKKNYIEMLEDFTPYENQE